MSATVRAMCSARALSPAAAAEVEVEMTIAALPACGASRVGTGPPRALRWVWLTRASSVAYWSAAPPVPTTKMTRPRTNATTGAPAANRTLTLPPLSACGAARGAREGPGAPDAVLLGHPYVEVCLANGTARMAWGTTSAAGGPDAAVAGGHGC